MANIGIRGQLAAGIAVATVSAIGFLGALSIFMIHESALAGKLNEARRIAGVFRGAAGVADYAGALKETAAVEAVLLRDSSGKTVFSAGTLPGKNPTPVFSEKGVAIYRTGSGWVDSAELLYVTAQASAHAVDFTVPLSDIAAYTAAMRRYVVFFALADSAIIIALGVYFLSLYIIRPVKRLEAAALKIAEGDLAARAEITGNTEISRLGSSFNTMAERVRDEIARLERVNRELFRAREELLRASTLASVGNLAAGVAHEIGNPLGAVSGYIEILKKGAAEEDREEILKRLSLEVERIDKIVREFLDLARPKSAPSRPVGVNRLLEETRALLTAEKRFAGINVELKLREGIPAVMIDGDKLRQVFMNLFVNAADAMGEVGTVTVETDNAAVEEEIAGARRKLDTVFEKGAAFKDYVVISFTDTGCGIPQEHLQRIFDPFFTTKEGRRAGLGLFVSEGIIKAYGGKIDARSIPQKGSTFRVFLPAA